MSKTAFITGSSSGGKLGFAAAATAIGAVVMRSVGIGMKASRAAKFAENPNVMGVNIANPVKWVAQKIGGEKAAKVVDQVISAPGSAMSKPMEYYASEDFAKNLGSGAAAKKILGEQSEQKASNIVMKTSTFGGKIVNGIGSALGVLDKQFNFSGRTDSKIEKKKAELASLRDSFSEVKNPQSRWDKIKSSMGMEVPEMAKAEDIAAFHKRNNTRKHVSAASYKQGEHSKMSLLERQNLRKAADDIYKAKSEEHKKMLSDGLKGLKDKKEIQAKTAELEDSFRQTFSKDEKATIKAAEQADARKDYIGETTAEVKGKLDESVKGKISKSATKNIDKYENAHTDLNDLNKKKDFWKNPTEGIKNRAKNVTLSEVADFTMRYGAVAQNGVASVKNTKIEIRTLKQLIGDLTGKNPKNISTWGALFSGNVSPVIKDARKQFFRSFLSTYITFGAGAVGQEVLAKKLKRKMGKDSILAPLIATAGFTLVQKAGDAIGSGGTLLQTYANTIMAQESGAELNAQDYANLLESASKDIRDIGGVGNYNTTLIARYYVDNQTPISDVMKDVSKGKAHLMELSNHGARVSERHGIMPSEAEINQIKPASIVQGEGKFTAQSRNQPKAGGKFADKAIASKQDAATTPIGFGG